MILIKEKDKVYDIFVTLSSRQTPTIPSNTYTMEIFTDNDGYDTQFDIFDHNQGGQRSNLFNIEVVSNPTNEDLTNPNLIKLDIAAGEYKYRFINTNGTVCEKGIFKILSEDNVSSSYNYNEGNDKSFM